MATRLNPQDHPSGTRFIYCTAMSTRTLLEATVIEWSPAGLVCVRYPHNDTSQWVSNTDRDLMDVVEVLPPTQEARTPVDSSTPDMPLTQTLSQLLRACDVAEQVSVVDGVLIARLPARFPPEMRSMLVGRVPCGAAGLECVEWLNDALDRLHARREAIGRDNAR